MSGPDAVIETKSIMTWKEDGAVRLLKDKGGGSSKPATSVPTQLKQTVKELPTHIAMVQKSGDLTKTWSYEQYLYDVTKAAKSFIKLGLEPYHGVCILGFNSPEWFISDLGAIFAAGFPAGIYTTNNSETCQYVAENCKANIIMVENEIQLQKILEVRSKLPSLKAIVQWNGNLKEKYDNVYTWEQFMKAGKDVASNELDERLTLLAPNKCCTLIYTSGTTGNPKGVMLSHDNFIFTANQCGTAAELTFGKDVLISYLPLSHVAAQLLDIHLPIVYGSTVHFAKPDALKGSLGDSLKEIRPTAFLGVPRVWEKMQEKMLEVGKQNGAVKKAIAKWAKNVGLRGNMNKLHGEGLPFGFGIANHLVFSKVRARLGLDRCNFCFTGAAPIMRETLDYFLSLNIPLLELYGMSECTGPHTLSLPNKFRLGSIGTEAPKMSTKLLDKDESGNGEVCMYGRHVFMGYLNMEEKTKEALDGEGWLHSGDIGRRDEDGFLYITGRIKELIITAGGENIAPVPIEDRVRAELPCLANCMLIGDKRKFLSMLLTLKTQVNVDTQMPLDTLTPAAVEWCKRIGSDATTVSQILQKKDSKVLAAVQKGIDRANEKAVSSAQNIQKWIILPRDFSVPGGELGPTLKLKRPVVTKMYLDTIDSFYSS